MVSVEVGMSRPRAKKAEASLYHTVAYTLLFFIIHLHEAVQVSVRYLFFSTNFSYNIQIYTTDRQGARLQVMYCASGHRPAEPDVTLKGRNIPLLNLAKCLGLTFHR